MKKLTIDSTKGMTFNLKNERVTTVTNEGKKYSYEVNPSKTKFSFKKISWSIPKWKGVFVVYGVNGNTMEPLEVKYSYTDLQKEFTKGQKKLSDGTQCDRYSWMVDLLSSGTYNELKIFTSNSI